MINKGKRYVKGDMTRLTEDLLFPNHWCLLSSILMEPGHQRKGHYNDNYPLSFIESAKLCYKLHSALYL